MFLTVTLNAALDVTYRVENVAWGEANRVGEVARRAGGKGINVARVLHRLGHETVVTGLAGGATGAAIRADLAEAGLPDRLVEIAGESRRTLVLVEPERSTVFNELGPRVAAAEWSRFVDTFEALVAASRVAVLSGSLPPGLPHDAYGVLVRRAETAGVPVVLDTSSPGLADGIRARPAVVKPNLEELQAVVGRVCSTADDVVRAAREVQRMGAQAVVVTRGAEGMVAITPDGSWAGVAPERVSGNPTGAGDAVSAALAIGLADHVSWLERLSDALALGAAAVHRPVAGEVDLEVVDRLRPLVRVEKL